VTLALVVLLVVAGISTYQFAFQNGPAPSNGSSGTPAPGAQAATPGLATDVDPGLVDVYTLLAYNEGAAAGTGIVLTSSGQVLTNNHVIEGSTQVKVTDIGNGRSYSATVIGTDKAKDVALLQIQGASHLATVKIGDSSKLGVGDAVTAIGNAGGTGGAPSVSTGDITALDQAIIASDEVDNSEEHLSGLFQTDASLQPGDSGGPLVSNSGKVIAIDTAASSSYQFQEGASASFAIPINEAISVVHSIDSGTNTATIHIGPAALLGVEVESPSSGSGALVVNVLPKTPAQSAGMVAGDVITSVNGQSVSSPTALANLLQTHHPGEVVKVVWVDGSGRQYSASVSLTAGPAN
jgi:S1-C subfamily serine protease